MTVTGLRKWALMLALWFILQRTPLRAQVQYEGTTVSGSTYASSALGFYTTATGPGSIALGFDTTASGCYSIASGVCTMSTGDGATAFGAFTTASGWNSMASGEGTTAGAGATAFGYYTSASGYYSMASGRYSSASGSYSTASGIYSTASGYNSTAAGSNTTSSAYDSFVVGAYNIGGGQRGNWVDTDPLFEVGNGTTNVYTGIPISSDALVVFKNGNTVVSGTLSVSGSNPILVYPAGDLSMGPFTSGTTPQQP